MCVENAAYALLFLVLLPGSSKVLRGTWISRWSGASSGQVRLHLPRRPQASLKDGQLPHTVGDKSQYTQIGAALFNKEDPKFREDADLLCSSTAAASTQPA